MPIYEYRCKRCENLAEVFHRSSREEKALSCPACGHDEMERQFSCFSSGRGSGGNAGSESGSCKPSSGFR
jgi:putative FmdB family regulatory protein